MGKKNKHSKDKLYKTVTELQSHHVVNRELELSALSRRLRFDSCCLGLNTVSGKAMGLSDDNGFCYVFECDTIVKFLEKYQIHPITGSKLSIKDLIELKFHRNNENQYHCPVIYKLFNQHSRIVVNRKSGNVYSYEAYHQLNLKQNNFKDLLTDEPFEKNDILTIQDPDKVDLKWNVSEFHYVKNKLRIDDDQCDSRIRDIEHSDILKSSLDEYKSKKDSIVETYHKIVGQGSEQSISKRKDLDHINSAIYSDGALSSSVTSTIAPVTNDQRAAILKDEEILYPRIKKKGYAQILTNHGTLNLELYCDRAPKTCHNFLLLASRGYYNDTCFHRLIKNFILQGGDPTGTGKGGQSAWNEPFKDECHGDLKHEGRGVLAMANSGPNTNKSQFYITFKGIWDHLDGKHTVFGRVVDGFETLSKIESIEVDKNDRPKQEVKIIRVIKHVDPYEEAEAAIAQERTKAANNGGKQNTDSSVKVLKKFRSGIGAYIDLDRINNTSQSCTEQVDNTSGSCVSDSVTDGGEDDNKFNGSSSATSLSSKLAALNSTKKVAKAKFGDFSNW